MKLGQTVPAQSPARWSRGRTTKPGTRQFRGSGTRQTQRVNTSSRTNKKNDQHITQIAKCTFFHYIHVLKNTTNRSIQLWQLNQSIRNMLHTSRGKKHKQYATRFFLLFFQAPEGAFLRVPPAGVADSWWTRWGQSQLVDTMGRIPAGGHDGDSPAGVAATATAAKAAAAGGGYGQSPSWWTLWGQSQLELQQQQQQ